MLELNDRSVYYDTSTTDSAALVFHECAAINLKKLFSPVSQSQLLGVAHFHLLEQPIARRSKGRLVSRPVDWRKEEQIVIPVS
jgi:hypothetical protein